jgi:hypothetical protein
MASKKDKFKQAMDSGQKASMSDLVDGIAKSHEKRIESGGPDSIQERQIEEGRMARSRDSVYNVSSDIRLEDYADSAAGGSGGGAGGIIRLVSGVVLALVVVWVLYFAWGALFGPSYILAISGNRISPEAAEEFEDQESVAPGADGEIYIHFQWRDEAPPADYIKINVFRKTTDAETEEAVLGRRPPSTAPYIQFAGPLDSGKYHVFVTDREGNVFKERIVSIR